MTVGELAERSGVSKKAIRELEGRGLVYSIGRSESNYRLFDETALWCVQMVSGLRSLGLTWAELEELESVYSESSAEAVDPLLAAMLEQAERRVQAQLSELEQTLRRIKAFRESNGSTLAGSPDATVGPPDPHRRSRPRAI